MYGLRNPRPPYANRVVLNRKGKAMKKILVISIILIVAGCVDTTNTSYNTQARRISLAQLTANLASQSAQQKAQTAADEKVYCEGFEDGYFAVCQSSRYAPSCNWRDWMPDEKTYRDGVRKGREAAISSYSCM